MLGFSLWADRSLQPQPGYDIVVQALSGVMDLTGEPDGSPVRSGIILGDYTTGVYAYAAIVSALYHRKNTGRGQYIDISLFLYRLTFYGFLCEQSLNIIRAFLPDILKNVYT